MFSLLFFLIIFLLIIIKEERYVCKEIISHFLLYFCFIHLYKLEILNFMEIKIRYLKKNKKELIKYLKLKNN